MDYIHLTLHIFNGNKVNVSLTIIQYDNKHAITMRCSHNAKHRSRFLPLFVKPSELPRCFDCIPWGNIVISKNYTRIGKVVCEHF